MNLVDTSGWLAYFTDEPNAKHFLSPLGDTEGGRGDTHKTPQRREEWVSQRF